MYLAPQKADILAFICSLLDERWDEEEFDQPFHPNIEPRWIIPGDTLPLLTVTLLPTSLQVRGFFGKNVATPKSVRCSIWCEDPSQKSLAERNMIRIFTQNNRWPTTQVFPEPGVHCLQVDVIDDNDDFVTSPVTFRRDVEIIVHYQDSY